MATPNVLVRAHYYETGSKGRGFYSSSERNDYLDYVEKGIKVNREIARVLLARGGLAPECAADGEEAAALAERYLARIAACADLDILADPADPAPFLPLENEIDA